MAVIDAGFAMNQEKALVPLGKAARSLIRVLGLDPVQVLRRAELPSDLLEGDGARVSLGEFYRLWSSVTEEANDPLLALKLGDASGIDFFDPAFFAAMCSPNMNVATKRLSEYKRLSGPFTLSVEVGDQATRIAFNCSSEATVHPTHALTEIVFLVNFIRRATRRSITPQSVGMPFEVPQIESFEAHFGCPIIKAQDRFVVFHGEDARRPFVTHDDEIWSLFEPQLRRQVDRNAGVLSTQKKVAHSLNALLPSGQVSIEAVANDLGMSKRTLQRRLADEGTNWIEALNEARRTLARHYLETTEFQMAEVSFLLGYRDPNSFFRAFQRWENISPEAWRAEQREARPVLN